MKNNVPLFLKFLNQGSPPYESETKGEPWDAPCQLQNFIIWEAPFLLLEGPLSKNPCILFEKSGWKGERGGGRGTRQKGYFVDIFFSSFVMK